MNECTVFFAFSLQNLVLLLVGGREKRSLGNVILFGEEDPRTNFFLSLAFLY